MYLIIVDTTQIQPYIFGSNRLRENIGGSHLVAQATGHWALQAVPCPNNINGDGTLDPNRVIMDMHGGPTELNAEVLYAGGGNVVVLFRDEEQAKAFTRKLSRTVLEKAPGLQLVIAGTPFTWGSDVLTDKVDEVFRVLAERKRAQALRTPLLGLGVTVPCQSTGLPATRMVRIGDDVYPASAEICAKLAVAQPQGGKRSEADERIMGLLCRPDEKADFTSFDDHYCFPSEFDDLGRSVGEYSYVAVVHADGDGMGAHIRDITDGFRAKEMSREYIIALREFSTKLSTAATRALQETLQLLVRRIEAGHGVILHNPAKPRHEQLTEIRLKRVDGKWVLPFRPLVLGGDDITFVCDGRLGLSLATAYLEQFQRQTEAVNLLGEGKGATACAGIAIVKAHYPFARAYHLAETLCVSAKKLGREIKENYPVVSCLDWHFARSGLTGELEEMRAAQYHTKDGSLALRPVTLTENPLRPVRAWPVVAEGIRVFQEDEAWAGRRNKAKALRDALRQGPDEVEKFLALFGLDQLPELPANIADTYRKKGWDGKGFRNGSLDGYCCYFDALELADWFMPLCDESGTGECQ